MKQFCFTVDDNIRFFKEITETLPKSIFDHPYLAVYKRLHEKYGIKIQLNLFFELGDFNLTAMTDSYKSEWQKNSDWLKLSFHSKLENVNPYISSDYDEVYFDCQNVHREILRFAGESSLAKTTTVHYCQVTEDGIRALFDIGVRGLLGLYGRKDAPRISYQSTPRECELMREGGLAEGGGMTYGNIDIILNSHKKDAILTRLSELSDREFIKVMIHEQYFYPDYAHYQPEFEEKLDATFKCLKDNGYESIFFEDKIRV